MGDFSTYTLEISRGSPRQLPGAGEDGVEHRLGQPAGERVLLAGVVAAEQRQIPDREFGPVCEFRFWRKFPKDTQRCVPRERARARSCRRARLGRARSAIGTRPLH